MLSTDMDQVSMIAENDYFLFLLIVLMTLIIHNCNNVVNCESSLQSIFLRQGKGLFSLQKMIKLHKIIF